MNKKQNSTKRPENKDNYKTSIVTEDALYEMTYDPQKDRTFYFKSDLKGTITRDVEEVEINGVRYKPLPPNNMLVQKKVVLFPSNVTPYISEEALIMTIQSFIHRYLDISEAFEPIATYYVLFSWLYDRFNEVPYLRCIGDFGSGKSRFLQVIGSICYKPIITGGATTPSPIFRIMDEIHGCLIIDEADFKASDMTSEIVKILNTGYQRGMSVLRSEGKGVFEVKAYEVFCPKIVATRETFTDKALESRFLVEQMGVGKLRANIPISLKEEFYQEAQEMRNRLLMWRLQNYFKPLDIREEPIEGIHPRLNQIAIPLLSIIKDIETREKLKKFIVQYNAELISDRGLSWESDIIFTILRLEAKKGMSHLTVNEITIALNEELPTGEDNLTARKVGWYLKARLQLKTYRMRQGYILSLNDNRKKLNFWKDRFGITDADIREENVNNVNFVNEIQETNALVFAEQLQF